LAVEENKVIIKQKCNVISVKVLLILCAKYFYNRLRFKVVIDKSCRGGATFFRTECMYESCGLKYAQSYGHRMKSTSYTQEICVHPNSKTVEQKPTITNNIKKTKSVNQITNE